MKLVTKVWCLPKEPEEKLQALHRKIVQAVVTGVPNLHLKGEQDMIVLFPTDAMSYGLGSDILVEISNATSLELLAEKVGELIEKEYPRAKIEVVATNPFSAAGSFYGYWYK